MKGFPAAPPELGEYDRTTVHMIYERLGCKDPLTRSFIRVMLTAVRVFDWKQQRYGTENIAAGGVEGVVIRLQDKVSRLKNLLKRGESPDEEPIEDSLGDSGVYGIIGLMARWGLWPGVVGGREEREKSGPRPPAPESGRIG